ncbi:MAG: hypothetical protein ACTSSA_08370 [Candidatus Freyarchaeota archaeon]
MSERPLGLIIISIFLLIMSIVTLVGGCLSYLIPMLNWEKTSLLTSLFLYYGYSPNLLTAWAAMYLIQLPRTTQTLITMVVLFILGGALFVSAIGFYLLKKWAFFFAVAYAVFNIIIPFIPPTLNLNVIYVLFSLTSNTLLVQFSYYAPAIIGFALLLYLPGNIRSRFEQK